MSFIEKQFSFLLKTFKVIKGSRTIAPWMISPWIIAPGQLSPRIIALEENCPPDNCPPGKFSAGKLPPHHKVYPKNNHPHSSKLPSESTMSELRKTMHCLRVL